MRLRTLPMTPRLREDERVVDGLALGAEVHAYHCTGRATTQTGRIGREYCDSWSPWLPLLSLSLSKNFPPASHNCMAASKHGKSLGSSRSLEGATLRLWLVSGRPLLSDWKEPMTGGEEPVVRLAAARVPNPPSHTACCNEHPSLGAATAPIEKKCPALQLLPTQIRRGGRARFIEAPDAPSSCPA